MEYMRIRASICDPRPHYCKHTAGVNFNILRKFRGKDLYLILFVVAHEQTYAYYKLFTHIFV